MISNSRGRHKNASRTRFIRSQDIYIFFFAVSRCQTQVIRSQRVPQNILKRLESPLDAE